MWFSLQYHSNLFQRHSYMRFPWENLVSITPNNYSASIFIARFENLFYVVFDQRVCKYCEFVQVDASYKVQGQKYNYETRVSSLDCWKKKKNYKNANSIFNYKVGTTGRGNILQNYRASFLWEKIDLWLVKLHT